MSSKGKGGQVTNRKERAEISRETLCIVEKGGYQCNKRSRMVLIRDSVEHSKALTHLFDSENLPKPPQVARFAEPCAIEVTNESTVSAIQRASVAGEEQSPLHVGCLNFASAKNPGGGFDQGAQAQEEALSRASALFPCLQTQMDGFCQPNRVFKSPMYLDLAIASPRVPFFRDGEQETKLLPEPLFCTVISMPAPNASVLLQRGHPETEIDLTLCRRAEIILRLASHYKIDVLILGAWGCGVFGNKPDKVARIFGRLLQNNYQHQFRRIIFGVLDKTEKKEIFTTFSMILGRGARF